MKLAWAEAGLNEIKIRLPIVIDKDIDYLDDLEQKYVELRKRAEQAGADAISLNIIDYFQKEILNSLRRHYNGDREASYKIIRNLICDIGDHPFATSKLNDSYAFPGRHESELQFFRSRKGNPSAAYTANEMLHLPKKLRAKSGNYRFSIPGNPSLYLSNTSYGCWIETGYLSDNEFNVSPVLLDGSQKVFNLAVSLANSNELNNCESSYVHCWLKLYMLTIATSYVIHEESRTFKSEYIISQSIMIGCKKLGYDAIAYYSKRVTSDSFALCAINLVLFVEYTGEYSDVANHMIMNDSFNYGLYKQLNDSINNKSYELRSVSTGYITNIGMYNHQYAYRETYYYDFDRFLFTSWSNKVQLESDFKWGVSTD